MQDLLRNMPPAALNDVWARRIRGEPAARRAAWIEAADTLRDAGGDDLARAQAVYWALRRELDAGREDDAPRVRAVLLSGVERDADFEKLAKTAAEEGESDLALLGQIALAQCACMRGENADAEHMLLEVLSSTRGRGDWLELKTASTLSLVFIRRGQEFEGLVLAHQAVAALGPDADPWAALAAHQRLCQSLRQVGDVDGQRAALERFESALARAPSPWSGGIRRYLHGARAELALDSGLMTIARGELAQMRSSQDDDSIHPNDAKWATLIEAHILRRLGQPQEALRLLPRPLPAEDLWSGILAANCAFDLGDPELAAGYGRKVLGVVQKGDHPSAQRGTGNHVKIASSLGTLFHEQGCNEDIVRQAFDEASRSAVQRLLDLQRCRKRLPEVASVTSESLASLGGYRRQFVREHAVFLDRLVPFLKEELRGGDSPLDDLLHKDDYLLICAWCHRVRERDGDWLPIGYFLPDRSSLRVTHGICPTCRKAMDRDTIDA